MAKLRNKGTISAWKDAIEKPEFRNSDQFYNRIELCKRAELKQFNWNGKDVSDTFVIQDEQTHDYYGMATDRYEVAQNFDVLTPVGIALGHLEANGIPFQGTIKESEKGKMIAVIEIGNEIKLADSTYHQTVMIGNSYNKQTALEVESGIRRLICGNGMYAIVGVTSKNSMKHIKERMEAAKMWDTLLLKYTEDAKNLGPLINRADAIEVPWQYVEPLYRGIGIKARTAEDIRLNLVEKVPEVLGKAKPSVWNVYNGGTEKFSHRLKGTFENNAKELSNLGRLLSSTNEQIAEYIEIGKEIEKAEENAKKDKKARKDNPSLFADEDED